ncbi:MAG TPA: LysR substrate-binding domain-containing protein [Cryomorphaceae bacterium]|nr:LysR substrate-binding domain-containing protein [Cryomorphaceae bacterium]
MNFTLHQLKVFLQVVDRDSVTLAAADLHLTQPAVSSQLKLLQSQVGLPLTEVIGRKIHITDTGREFAELAKEILQKTEELDERMTSKKGKVSGKLRLSVVSTGKYFVPPILAEFKKAYPEVKISLDVSKREESEAALLDYEADFIIATSSASLDAYAKIDFLPNPLILAAPANPVDFELPSGRATPKDLKKLPFIFRERGSGTRKRMDRFLEQEGIEPENSMELVTNEAVKQLILAGFGVSFLSIYSMRLELQHNELQIIKHSKLPLKGQWSLVWLKGKKHTPATEAFLNFLVENSDEWIDRLFPWVKEYV